MSVSIPAFLVDQVRDGQVVLFLGSGASLSAIDKDGNHPPDGKKLAELLNQKFLGGEFKGYELSRIGELAISETNLTLVQEFIRDIILPFLPSRGHYLLPKFSWHGIATTNYDRLIEKAYSVGSPIQRPIPILTDQDPIEDPLRNPQNLLVLKLHGCVTRTADETCQFILSPDQYTTHRRGRQRLFNRLEEWGREKSIIFVGHSLVDSDIRAILLELTSRGDFQPRYYYVAPTLSEPEVRLLLRKKITPIAATFDDFMIRMDADVPSTFRLLATVKPAVRLPIMDRFISQVAYVSERCEQFLREDVEYVKTISSTDVLSPKQFYRGISRGWSSVEQNLDVKRTIADTILSDNFLIGTSGQPGRLRFVLIRGHAGAGKTILMKRLAWDASHLWDCLCLFLLPNGKLDTVALKELMSCTNEQVYLFVDRPASRVDELKSLFEDDELRKRPLTIIACERINEWNVECSSLSPFITIVYELQYLHEREIKDLLTLLKQHDSLGMLSNATEEEKLIAFKNRAGRQLLVALHEATLGKQFEEIVEDEYNNIKPLDAQLVYLTICVLNRFDEPVRAGIVSRVHGVSFEKFSQEFLGPLEQVVIVSENKFIRDFEYRARHAHIADIVFHRVLQNQNERFDVYVRALKGLDLGYTADFKTFWHMIKAKHLLEIFTDHTLISKIYAMAQEVSGEDPYLYHQRAIYEMNRPDGNMRECYELLKKAESLAPIDKTIKHSQGEYFYRLASSARTSLEKERYLDEATALAKSLTRYDAEKPHAYVTLLKSMRSRLEDELAKDASSDNAISKLVQDFERSLVDAIQRYPDDSYLLDEESKVADLLGNSGKALAALKKAFERNPRSSYIALRLYTILSSTGKTPEAKLVLENALAANPGEIRLHYAFTKFLLINDPENVDAIQFHAKRAFVPGDKNYDAQVIYARCLFLRNEIGEYKKIRESLRLAYVDYDVKTRPRYPTSQFFSGVVVRVEGSYCFVSLDGTGNWVHLAKENVEGAIWTSIQNGIRLRFRIAFTFLGVSAVNVSIE